jgi:hypothetical protein
MTVAIIGLMTVAIIRLMTVAIIRLMRVAIIRLMTVAIIRLMRVAIIRLITKKYLKRICVHLQWWLEISNRTGVRLCNLHVKCAASGIIFLEFIQILYLHYLWNLNNYRHVLNM